MTIGLILYRWCSDIIIIIIITVYIFKGHNNNNCVFCSSNIYDNIIDKSFGLFVFISSWITILLQYFMLAIGILNGSGIIEKHSKDKSIKSLIKSEHWK